MAQMFWIGLEMDNNWSGPLISPSKGTYPVCSLDINDFINIQFLLYYSLQKLHNVVSLTSFRYGLDSEIIPSITSL